MTPQLLALLGTISALTDCPLYEAAMMTVRDVGDALADAGLGLDDLFGALETARGSHHQL